MIIRENGIDYKVDKRALLLTALGTVGGTYAIAKFLGVTREDVIWMRPNQLLKLIPAYLLSMIVSMRVVPKIMRFANPVKKARKKRSKSNPKRKQRRSKKN